MSANPSDASSGQPLVSVRSRYLILVIAFLGWGFSGVHMSLNGIVMRVASKELLASEFAEQGIAESPATDAAVSAALLEGFDEDGSGTLNSKERMRAQEASLSQWFGWLTCAFLFGAATGGYVLGYVGDRIGRAKAMAASILCYSIFSAGTYWVQSTEQLLVLRFLTCMGIGGMWPNGIALLSEVWPGISRAFLAGAIGTAANVGILCFALYTVFHEVTLEDWRWTFLVGASPIVLGLFSLAVVPESPRWLALRRGESKDSDRPRRAGLGEIFQPPLLKTTLLGILLGTIPLFGGWGVSNWASAWASEVGDTVKSSAATDDGSSNTNPARTEAEEGAIGQDANEPPAAEANQPDPVLKSMTVVARSLPGSISSLLGGVLALWLGRRRSYFLLSLCALICTQFLFRVENPVESATLFTISIAERNLEITVFLAWTAALGFFSGFFFGWLPLCLPELFPTRVRSTGAGVSFNWGRILTALGVLATAAVLKEQLQGQYDIVGRYTGLIYAVGMVVILLVPSTLGQELED